MPTAVARVDRIATRWKCLPSFARSDNDLEPTARTVSGRCRFRDTETSDFDARGPWLNAFAESCGYPIRDGLIALENRSIRLHAQILVADWRKDDVTYHPLFALGTRTALKFAILQHTNHLEVK